MADIIIAGDFAFRPEADLLSEDSFDTKFGEISSIVKSVDYSIINLESPIIYGNPTPIRKLGPNLYAKPKSFMLIEYLGFKGVTLANNHFRDQGDKGVKETLDECLKYGIEYFGGGNNIDEASKTKVIQINEQKIAIINCCEVEFSIASDSKGGANPLNPISQYYAIKEAKKITDHVIVIVHGGIEHFQYPTIRMQQTYRFFIDAGASAVVNHHQHCYSGYEVYNGAPIIYGLGNFFFPRFRYYNTFWNFGYMVHLVLKETISFEIIPYNQCSKDTNIILLKGKERADFVDKIQNICNVISNYNELKRINSEFMDKSLSSYDWLFQPYDNKYLRALANRGLIPKFISFKKIDEVMSLVKCQSHLDRFLNYLHKRTSKDV